MRPSKSPLYTADRIQQRVEALAAAVSQDLPGKDVIALIVLKGGLHFGSDLIRKLSIPVTVDFIRAKSYTNTKSSGQVQFLVLPTLPLEGKHVLIIEDILDTGRTAHAIRERIHDQGPARIYFCTLFDKPKHREVDLVGDYVGFELDDPFVIGYGMDYEERYRDLPDVYILEPGE